MKRINLNGKWQARCIFPSKDEFLFEGNVPGSAINDLSLCGALPSDLFFADNADSVLKYENCDYVYERNFEFHGERSNAFLTFVRIDTYCDLFLNGKRIYHSENGNIEHRIPVSDALLEGGKSS